MFRIDLRDLSLLNISFPIKSIGDFCSSPTKLLLIPARDFLSFWACLFRAFSLMNVLFDDVIINPLGLFSVLC